MRVLIIEDDKELSCVIREGISGMFECDQVFDGEDGLFQAQQDIYDIIILDIMLPLMDGYEVLSKLRASGITTPVLILTAKDGIDDKLRGFRGGADDYLVKPFHREELMLRLEAIIRRAGGVLRESTLQFKELTLGLRDRRVYIEDRELELAGKLFDILEYLIGNQNIILTREQIFDRVWGFDSVTTANVVEVYASNLRKALKPYGYDKYIRTVRGVGYMLSDNGDRDE